MSYTALYRKFRPDSFTEVKGQDHIVTTLKNQIAADRIGHAYLFCGTRGTGKTSVAKLFAKAVNCEHPVDGNPCHTCASCRAIAAGASMNVIEIDAASNNGVDNIREIREEVSYRPASGRYKVYIIDEVHMLSIGAFNALLKTLEEPPSYVIFILATTEAHKIPVTILSRCQRYDFRRISIAEIQAHLEELTRQEGVETEEKALRYIAKKADGSMRDALSLLDQCIAFYLGEKLTYDHVLEVLGAVDMDVFSEMLRRVLRQDVVGMISYLDELVMQGRDLGQFVNDFTWYLRNLMLVKASDKMEDVLDVSTENLEALKEEAGMVRSDTLMRYIRVLSELANQIRQSSNKRVAVEVALIKLCRPETESDELSVMERLRRLEQMAAQGMLGGGAPGQTGWSGRGSWNGQPGSMPSQGSWNSQPGAVPGQGSWNGQPGSMPDQGDGNGQPGSGAANQGVNGMQPGSMPGQGGWNGQPGGASGREAWGSPADLYPVKAAPRDLQQIKAMWRSIVGETEGRFRYVLAAAEPKFNSSSEEDNRLYVVFADFLAESYIHNVEYKTALERIISDKLGKAVEVQFLLAEDEGIQKARLSSIDVDAAIHEFVHMDVEIED